MRSSSVQRASRPPRERVGEIQRRRMLTAMVEVVADVGAEDATVAKVVARAGVSRRTFYELFADRDHCFLAACEDAIEIVTPTVVRAYRAEASLRAGIRAGLLALLDFFETEPGVGQLLIVGTLAAGPRVREYRARKLEGLVAALADCTGDREKRGSEALLTAEGVLGGVLAVLYTSLSGTRSDDGVGETSLRELVNPLMAMVLLPYLGRAAAARELASPPDRRSLRPSRGKQDPLRELEMRLTYRTLRALSAVAANPGSSNRVIAEGAGISDQGQISKLLARLQRLGLVQNGLAAEPVRGEPNAWKLTDKGRRLHGALDMHAA